jgi:hypothetical protein
MVLSGRYQSTDDAGLTLGLPVELSVVSGLNALAHCADSMWAPRVDPGLLLPGFHRRSPWCPGPG